MNRQLSLHTAGLILALLAAGCQPASQREVVVYAALDSEFSQPILKEFSAATGIAARPKFDVESTKTVGLTQLIFSEAQRPRCDVFWNNEILNTLRLERAGLLEAYIPPTAELFPAMFRSADGLWHGFAARCRVIIVNTQLVPEGERPASILDLADARWKGKCGLAKPLFGTTATHAACLFAHWGDERAQEYFDSLLANDVQVLSGNKQLALAVSAGDLHWGLTDTDDALIEIAAGHPVAMIYPDQEAGGLGALFIPNTLAIMKNGPHPDEARRLIDYLLTADVERRLAASPSVQIPLSEGTPADPRTQLPDPLRQMQVDFQAAADHWDAAAEYLKQHFTAP